MQYGHVSYQGSHRITASREDIFRQVRRWAAFRSTRTIYTGTYTTLKIPSPTTAFNISDNLLGDVISSGVIDRIQKKPNNSLVWPSTYYSISIECYDNYYRLTLTNFYTFGFPTPHYLDVRDTSKSYKETKEFYARIDQEVMKLITELQVFVSNEVNTSEIH